MKFLSIVFLTLLAVVCVAPVLAVDFRDDTTFNPVFSPYDIVQDVFVQADGKIVVGGAACPSFSGNCTPYLKRLNPDGSIDSSFNAAISPTATGSSHVFRIRHLSNGQYLITGVFNVGSVRSNYARLNSDGTLDASMIPTTIGFDFGAMLIEPTPDGKFIVCTERTINSQLYKIAHRINSDGSTDPTFRVTFMDGFCEDLKVAASGKLYITVSTQTGQTPVKPVYRLNSDGSKDTTFDADLPVGSYGDGLTELPDGKLLITSSQQGQNTQHVRKLTSSGTLDSTIPLCAGSFFLPQTNGEILTGGCKRWTGYFGNRLTVARILPDGSVDPTLDAIYLDGGLSGLKEAGNGEFYAFGEFRATQSSYDRRKLIRLEPNTTPLKAKFDFDNDGRSDFAVFRPSDRYWYINQSTGGSSYNLWGLSTDLLAAGHFDSDGKTDIGVFRDGIMHAYSPVFGHRQLYMGQTGDKPFLGNFEDSGIDIGDFATRGLRNGSVQWFIRHGDSAAIPVGGASQFAINGELITDKPVIGDFNGDSRDELGYFRDGSWNTYDRYNYAPPGIFQWGVAGDIPVPGDYDGDRQTDYAVFRPSTGVWWVRLSAGGYLILTFGQNGDIPVPADYDGDGKVDIAIFRNGQWWQYLSGTGSVRVDQWGSAGDKPIQAQNQQ